MSDTEFKNKEVKTRKDRRCDWCGEKIDAGSLSIYRAGVFEGDFYSCYMHTECNEALRKTDRELLMDGYYPHEQHRGMTIQNQYDHA